MFFTKWERKSIFPELSYKQKPTLHSYLWRIIKLWSWNSAEKRNLQCPSLYLCMYFLAGLGLCCFAQTFSSCSKQGPPSSCCAEAPHCSGFSCCRAQTLGTWASVFVAHRLSRSSACGIFPDQGSNPCLLHWQADSHPVSHQGSLSMPF